jgi:hypothetical protein
MVCKKCTSENQRSLNAELVASYREFENLNRTPFYVSQTIWVCLDCGHTELVIPAAELETLKREASEPKSQSGSDGDGTVNC